MSGTNQVSQNKKTAKANLRLFRGKIRRKLEVRLAIRMKNLAEEERQYQNALLTNKSSGCHQQRLPLQDRPGYPSSRTQCPTSPTTTPTTPNGATATRPSLAEPKQASTTSPSSECRIDTKLINASTSSPTNSSAWSNGTHGLQHRSPTNLGAPMSPGSSRRFLSQGHVLPSMRHSSKQSVTPRKPKGTNVPLPVSPSTSVTHTGSPALNTST